MAAYKRDNDHAFGLMLRPLSGNWISISMLEKAYAHDLTRIPAGLKAGERHVQDLGTRSFIASCHQKKGFVIPSCRKTVRHSPIHHRLR
jgi:hypothetical protein